jgi:hypothetical protein
MIQEQKELLLKDLCGRLPFGVICKFTDIFDGCEVNNILHPDDIGELFRNKLDCKPYLFPLSSMTERQCYKLASIRSGFQDCWKYIKTPIPLSICNFEQIDWFHKNHLDYRGLIEKGLAIDATGLNIY